MKSIVTALLIVFTSSVLAYEGKVTVKYKTYNKVADYYTFVWSFSASKCMLEMNRQTAEKSAPTYFIPDILSGKLFMFAKDPTAKEKNYFAINAADIRGNSGNVTGQATGEKKTINGLECDKFVFQSASETCEAWVAKSITVDWKSYAPFFKTSLEIQGLATMNIIGFPVSVTTKDERGLIVNNYELQSVIPGKVAEAELALPNGYTLFGSPK